MLDSVSGGSEYITLPTSYSEIYLHAYYYYNNSYYISSTATIIKTSINQSISEVFYLTGGHRDGDTRDVSVLINEYGVKLHQFYQDGKSEIANAQLLVFYR